MGARLRHAALLLCALRSLHLGCAENITHFSVNAFLCVAGPSLPGTLCKRCLRTALRRRGRLPRGMRAHAHLKTRILVWHPPMLRAGVRSPAATRS